MATKKVKVPASRNAKPVTKKPAPKPAAKPNSKASAPASNTRPGGAITMPNSARAGVNLPKTGARAERTATQITQLRQSGTTSTAKAAAKAGLKGAAKAAAKAGLKGVAGRALIIPAIGAQIADVASGFNKLANHPFFTKNRNKPVSKDANGRSSQGIRVSDKGNKRDYVSAPTGSQEYNDYRSKQIEAEKARLKNVGNDPARSTSSSTPSRSTSTPARIPSSVTRSSAPKAPAAPAKPGQKWDDFNPNRGTSKSNNPLLDRDKGGIKLRDRMKERENRDDQTMGPVKDGRQYGQALERQQERKDNTAGPTKDSNTYGDYLKRQQEKKKKKGY